MIQKKDETPVSASSFLMFYATFTSVTPDKREGIRKTNQQAAHERKRRKA